MKFPPVTEMERTKLFDIVSHRMTATQYQYQCRTQHWIGSYTKGSAVYWQLGALATSYIDQTFTLAILIRAIASAVFTPHTANQSSHFQSVGPRHMFCLRYFSCGNSICWTGKLVNYCNWRQGTDYYRKLYAYTTINCSRHRITVRSLCVYFLSPTWWNSSSDCLHDPTLCCYSFSKLLKTPVIQLLICDLLITLSSDMLRDFVQYSL